MLDVYTSLDRGGLRNASARQYVRYWAGLTGAARVEVVSVSDDARLIGEALAAGEILPAGEGRYYARSHAWDTARLQERTFVATGDPGDQGWYNHWRPAGEMRPLVEHRMRGASAGKTMYVLPYLMAPPGSPLERYAAGVQLTDCRTVALHMIRMARVGAHYLDNLADPARFVRAVHVTGDLDGLGQGTPGDHRYFVTIADQRTILHFGSSCGISALLGRIAHGLRQAAWDGWTSGEFLAGQFMLMGITDQHTGRRYHICGSFPGASGKTSLAMMAAPDALGGRYQVHFYGDDIAWLRVDPGDGRIYAINPESGVLGIATGTSEATSPDAIASMAPGTGTLLTNVAYHDDTQKVWWEGRTPAPPSDVTGWRDWTGTLISDRPAQDASAPWAHPDGRFTTTLATVPNLALDAGDPRGVPIDAIIFGGRASDREPLIRAIPDLAEGVYDGLTLGAEATFAAEGTDGRQRYDPMSMRLFLSCPEGAYAAHWLKLFGSAASQPIFAHVNWFQRDPGDGHYLWPGYCENLRPLLWLLELRDGKVDGRRTPVGILPAPGELNLDGLAISPHDLQAILSVDAPRWQREMRHRQLYLARFPGLPPEIWQAHQRVAAALDTPGT